jgi:hypothetical protein
MLTSTVTMVVVAMHLGEDGEEGGVGGPRFQGQVDAPGPAAVA